MIRGREVWAAVALFALLSVPARAGVVLDADADTYVHQGGEGLHTGWRDNFGNASELQLRPVQLWSKKVYIRFDLSTVSGPITSATLALNVTVPRDGTAYLYGLNDLHAGEAWVEGNGETGVPVPSTTPPDPIVWHNSPAVSNNTTAFDTNHSVLLGSFSTSTATVSFSSAALADFVNADTDDLVTLMLAGGHTSTVRFASKEHGAAAGPTLELDVPLDVVPEPTALGLIGIVSLLARRRRS